MSVFSAASPELVLSAVRHHRGAFYLLKAESWRSMAQNTKRTRSQKGWGYSSAVLVLALVCVALFAHEVFGEHGWLSMRHQQKEFRSLQQEIHQLQHENQQLQTQVDALKKSDPKAIEKQAREQMHMARPGEVIIALPDQGKEPRPQDPAVTFQKDGNEP